MGKEALNDWFPEVYAQLRRVAQRYLQGELPGHTLHATAVVHEAYVRLAETERHRWKDKQHFFATAARVLRHVLVDHAVARRAQKRGGGAVRVTLDERIAADAADDAVDVQDLDRALKVLETKDATWCRIVELRYFGGLTVDEVAKCLDVSSSTIKREWNAARLWLYRELKKS